MKIIKIEVLFEEREAIELLTDAVETGAISAWARIGNKRRILKHKEADLVGCIQKFTVYEIGDDDSVIDTHEVSEHTLNVGVQRLFANGNKYSYTAGNVLRNDLGSDDMDLIIQLGLFDELRYS
jgi:hypothetical protein